MLTYHLRALGVPAATLVANEFAARPAHRVRLLRNCDRVSGIENSPFLFPTSQLREGVEFLKDNVVLIVAVSGGKGSAFTVDDGVVSVPISPSAFRIASMADARVIPCTIVADKGGRATITLGKPVPDEYVKNRNLHCRACGDLFRFFLQSVRAVPGQSDAWLIERFQTLSRTEILEPFAAPNARRAERASR